MPVIPDELTPNRMAQLEKADNWARTFQTSENDPRYLQDKLDYAAALEIKRQQAQEAEMRSSQTAQNFFLNKLKMDHEERMFPLEQQIKANQLRKEQNDSELQARTINDTTAFAADMSDWDKQHPTASDEERSRQVIAYADKHPFASRDQGHRDLFDNARAKVQMAEKARQAAEAEAERTERQGRQFANSMEMQAEREKAAWRAGQAGQEWKTQMEDRKSGADWQKQWNETQTDLATYTEAAKRMPNDANIASRLVGIQQKIKLLEAEKPGIVPAAGSGAIPATATPKAKPDDYFQ